MNDVVSPARSSSLQEVPLFRGVLPETRARLEDGARVTRVLAGEWVIRAGDEADALYVVRSGRLRVVVERDGEQTVVRELGAGAALGELALLTRSSRSASVQAVRDSELLMLDANAFDELVETDASFAAAVARELAAQLQRSGGLDPPSPRARVFSVEPLAPHVDAQRFAQALAEGLQRFGTVAVLHGNETADGHGVLVERAERDCDAVVLAAAESGSEWASFARRQADRALLVADADTSIGREARGHDLVLVGPLAPGITNHWLEGAQPHTHHLVYPADYGAGARRAARRISGHALGVVLSGGGARGFAHIGALAALTEAGHEIDRIGGCSMGAFVAAMAAMGWETEQMRDRCHEELVRRAPFNDWTVPRVALIRSRRAARMLRRVFGELRVEDLPRPLYTVSADLLSSRVVVHRRGPLFEAVARACRSPGSSHRSRGVAGCSSTVACSTTCRSI